MSGINWMGGTARRIKDDKKLRKTRQRQFFSKNNTTLDKYQNCNNLKVGLDINSLDMSRKTNIPFDSNNKDNNSMKRPKLLNKVNESLYVSKKKEVKYLEPMQHEYQTRKLPRINYEETNTDMLSHLIGSNRPDGSQKNQNLLNIANKNPNLRFNSFSTPLTPPGLGSSINSSNSSRNLKEQKDLFHNYSDENLPPGFNLNQHFDNRNLLPKRDFTSPFYNNLKKIPEIYDKDKRKNLSNIKFPDGPINIFKSLGEDIYTKKDTVKQQNELQIPVIKNGESKCFDFEMIDLNHKELKHPFQFQSPELKSSLDSESFNDPIYKNSENVNSKQSFQFQSEYILESDCFDEKELSDFTNSINTEKLTPIISENTCHLEIVEDSSPASANYSDIPVIDFS